MVKQITKAEQMLLLQKAFQNVFKTNDPFGEMFQNCIGERLILCPIEGYYLNEQQFVALVNTVTTLDENKICISEVESEECFSTQGYKHWTMPIPTRYDEYLHLPIVLENAIFSANGKWGMLISHEEHAVIGGTQEFISKFKNNYADWDKGFVNFCDKWKYNEKHYNSSIEWLPKFIKHITGKVQ